LPLARLRGRGELTEIRAADLRFTPDEAAEYLNGVMGLALTAQDVAALEGRTEGWITAIQLAALSMQGREDIAGFIVLHTPQFSEYTNHLDTSYSCAKMLPDGTGIQIRLKAAELAPGEAPRIAHATANMIQHFTRIIASHAICYMNAEQGLDEGWGIDSPPGQHSGEIDQNN